MCMYVFMAMTDRAIDIPRLNRFKVYASPQSALVTGDFEYDPTEQFIKL